MVDYDIVGLTDKNDIYTALKFIYLQTGDDKFLARFGKSLNLQQTIYPDTIRFTAPREIDADVLSEQLKEKGLVLSLVR